MRRIAAAYGLDACGSRRGLNFTLGGGAIAAVEPADGSVDDIIVMPALVNAHDHARPMRSSSIGSFAKPLEIWLHRLAMLGPVDPYLAALAPLGRAALGGQGAVMVHCTRPIGLTDLPTEAAQVARAAADIGVRIAFGVGMRDQNPLTYGSGDDVLAQLSPDDRAEIEVRFLAPPLSVAEQVSLVDAVAERVQSPMVDVQYAPNGPQWCSDALWEAVAEASDRTGRRITTHLLETKYQREWADRTYPGGMIKRWKEIGLLSPRLTLAHCVYARPDELDMIAEAGCTIVVNTSSNLALRSGIAPVADMLARGCKVALGVDGQAFDEDDDALRELRLLWSLHAGWGFDLAIPPREALAIALENGRTAVGAPDGGRLTAGAPADLVILERAALDEDGMMELDPLDLLFTRAARRHVRELMVAGRTIVRDGQIIGVDIAAAHREMRDQFRAGLASRTGFRAALPAFEDAVRRHYARRLGCC
jgi:cytosine/adenosine deaminase-related metal-dependent hydrolase